MAAPVAPAGGCGQLTKPHRTTANAKMMVPARFRKAFTLSHKQRSPDEIRVWHYYPGWCRYQWDRMACEDCWGITCGCWEAFTRKWSFCRTCRTQLQLVFWLFGLRGELPFGMAICTQGNRPFQWRFAPAQCL